MLPFMAWMTVVLVCPKCRGQEHRLAPSVKRGMHTCCRLCGHAYQVTTFERVGSPKR